MSRRSCLITWRVRSLIEARQTNVILTNDQKQVAVCVSIHLQFERRVRLLSCILPQGWPSPGASEQIPRYLPPERLHSALYHFCNRDAHLPVLTSSLRLRSCPGDNLARRLRCAAERRAHYRGRHRCPKRHAQVRTGAREVLPRRMAALRHELVEACVRARIQRRREDEEGTHQLSTWG